MVLYDADVNTIGIAMNVSSLRFARFRDSVYSVVNILDKKN